MASVFYEKTLTFPGAMRVGAARGVVGTPYETTFGSVLTNAMFEALHMLKRMEAAVVSNGFTHVTPIDLGTSYEEVFNSTEILTEFQSQTLIAGWTTLDNNAVIPAFRRHYKIGDAETLPLYMRIEVGMRGYSQDEGSNTPYSRYYANLSFSATQTFNTFIAEHNLSTTMGAYTLYGNGSNYTGKLAFVLTADSLALYPSSVFMYGYNNDGNYQAFGKTTTTANYNYFAGIVLSKTKAYIPSSPMSYVTTAMTGPAWLTPNTADVGLATGFSPINVSGAPILVTPDGVEQRAICAPPAAIPNTLIPARKFAAPFFFVGSNGVVYEYPNLFWMTDPFRDRLDIVETTINYAGQQMSVVALPCLNAMDTNKAWTAATQTYVIGVKL